MGRSGRRGHRARQLLGAGVAGIAVASSLVWPTTVGRRAHGVADRRLGRPHGVLHDPGDLLRPPRRPAGPDRPRVAPHPHRLPVVSGVGAAGWRGVGHGGPGRRRSRAIRRSARSRAGTTSCTDRSCGPGTCWPSTCVAPGGRRPSTARPSSTSPASSVGRPCRRGRRLWCGPRPPLAGPQRPLGPRLRPLHLGPGGGRRRRRDPRPGPRDDRPLRRLLRLLVRPGLRQPVPAAGAVGDPRLDLFDGLHRPLVPQQPRSMPTNFDAACRRSPQCATAEHQEPWRRIVEVAAAWSRPRSTGTVPDASGHLAPVTMGPVGLIDLINDAAGDPLIYRALDAAARSLLVVHDPAPCSGSMPSGWRSTRSTRGSRPRGTPVGCTWPSRAWTTPSSSR